MFATAQAKRAMKTVAIWFLICCRCFLFAFADTCAYSLDASKFEFGIDCAAGVVQLVEGSGLRLACPSGGSDTTGIWIQSKQLEAKTFSSEAAFIAWQAPLTNRRLALQVLHDASVAAYAVHMPQPALLGSPSVLAVNSSHVERWFDLGEGGMWQAGSLTGGLNTGMSKVVVSAKAKNADGLVKTAEATTALSGEDSTRGSFRVRFEITAAAISTEPFEVTLTAFTGLGWNGAIFDTLTCSAVATSASNAATTAPAPAPTTTPMNPTTNDAASTRSAGVVVLALCWAFMD